MQTLSSTEATHAVHALRAKLPPEDFDLLVALAGRLDGPGNTVTVAVALKLLFPTVANHDTATKKLSELIKRFNAAAKAAGTGHTLHQRGGKRAGAEGRTLSFSGPATLSSQAELLDLASVEKKLVLEQRGQPAKPLVLITVNKHEGDAVLDVFLGDREHKRDERGGLVYDRLGVHGGFDLWHTTTEMGASGPGATLVRVSEVIAELKPVAVLAVGIAFGVNPEKQLIGQVLVSEKLQAYEPQRVGNMEPILRGDRVTPSTDWLQRAKGADGRWRRDSSIAWPRVQFGLLLSGEKLVDNVDYRDALIKLTGGEAIGGEMEGAGLYTATHARKVDWLIIKAVCDYADGNKSHDKQERQKLAARCAAQVARAIVDIDWNPANKPLPALACSAMGISDLSKAGPIVAGRAKPVSLRKTSELESNAQLAGTETDGVNVQAYLLDWVKQQDAPPLFALLGEYGMGKTIACQQLVKTVDELRRDDPSLPTPLYFDLRKLTGLRERVPKLDEILQECIDRGWNRSTSLIPKVEQIHSLVREGALVVFDGLDEALVHLREADGQTFTQELLRLLPRVIAPEAARSRLLISCRTHYFRSLRDQQNHFTGQERGDMEARTFDALILLPFSDEQIKQYFQAVLPDRDLDEVMKVIGSVHNLTELSQRPYTLRLISELLPEIERLRSDGRTVYGVTLYREMVNRWLERDSGKHHLRPEHKRRLAAHLASELWRRGQRMVAAAELESWFQVWRQSQADIAARYTSLHPDWLEEDLRTATFFVREDGDTAANSGFRFAHSSLQEYFLAEHLYKALRDDDKSAWVMPVPSKETLRFLGQLIGEANDAADLPRLTHWSKSHLAQVGKLLLMYANHARLEQPPLPCPNLAGMDLTGAQLEDCELGSENAQVPVWNLGDVKLINAELRRAKLRRLQLEKADLSGARLDHAEWLGGSARDCNFSNTNLCGVQFHNLDLTGADWSGADAYHANFLLCRAAPLHFPLARLAPDNKRQHSNLDRVVGTRHRGAIRACAWSPDGQRLSSASEDGSLRLWDAISGAPVLTLEGHHNTVSACAWSPDGQRVLSASYYDGTVHLWDATSGTPLLTLEGHHNTVSACAWSPDGQRLLSASHDETLRLWDAISGAPLLTLVGHRRPVTACAWSPDGQRLLSASRDGSMRLWDAISGTPLLTLEGHHNTVSACAWSPDGQRLLSASHDDTLRVWDAVSGAHLLTLEGHDDWVTACAWSPDGRRLLSASHDNTLRLWDAISGAHLLTLKGHGDWVTACAWSPDGQHLLSASYDDTLRLWDAISGAHSQQLILKAHRHAVIACAWSPNGQRLLSASHDNTLRLWDAITGASLLTLEGHRGPVNACAWSPDGQRLLSASHDNTLRLWDAISGAHLLTLEVHGDWLTACAWSPDGQRLLSASDDRSLRLWDAISGAPLLTLEGHRSTVAACAWSPDGQRILSASQDGTLRTWNAVTGVELYRILHTNSGHALIRDNRIEAANGDAWRELSWQVPDGNGGYEIVPAETFGELPAWPALPQSREQTAT